MMEMLYAEKKKKKTMLNFNLSMGYIQQDKYTQHFNQPNSMNFPQKIDFLNVEHLNLLVCM